MALSVKFCLEFRVAGTKIVLESGNAGDGATLTPDSARQPLVYNGMTSGLNLKLTDVLNDLLQKITGESAKIIPNDFLPDIALRDIYVSFANTTGEINLLALAEIDKKEIRFTFQYRAQKGADTESRYAISIQGDLMNLSGLPMVGEQLEDVSIKNTGFVYTSAKGEYTLPSLSDAAEDGGKARDMIMATAKAYDKGFNFTGDLKYSATEAPFTLALPVAENKQMLRGLASMTASGADPDSLQPGVKWININKKVGPLQISKIGFAYKDGRITFLFTGDLGLSALVFSMEGLGLSFLPRKLLKGQDIEPEFKLSGLGLTVSKGPLKISGMFIKVGPKEGEAYSFYGAAQITTAKFSISGIGAFAKSDNDTYSFFIYAIYLGPIGGPAFLYITGVAAGFGYNRRVREPKIEEVRDFPLVAMALNPQEKGISGILQDLINKDVIPPSEGDFWLAVGIKFTSFKIIDAFVLLIIQFGNKLQFTILGLAVLKFPSVGTAIAYVELAIMARFGEDSDVIAVDAIITPNSFIFSKDCKLSGGFAFYTWISGKHEGDFVISLGGYHPKFNKPVHYPSVDRLALNWVIGDSVSIRGEMYYALTPTAIMAGGRWEVVYNLSFLSASLTVWADMIVYWAPFRYSLTAGVQIRIEARIKILFVRIYFKIEMGVQLRIWGPPFAGEVYVDWSIFSFTIPFGSSENSPPALMQWDQFATMFIPKKKDQLYTNPLDSRIINGVIKQYKQIVGAKEQIVSIVNPYDLVLTSESFVPITQLKVKTATGSEAELDGGVMMEKADSLLPGTYGKRLPAGQLGIKPMGVAGLDSKMLVWLERVDAGNISVLQPMAYMCYAKGVADALWGPEKINYNGPIPESKVLSNVLTGVQLHPFNPLATPAFKTKKLDELHPFDLYPGYPAKPQQILSMGYRTNRSALSPIAQEHMFDKVKDATTVKAKTDINAALSLLGFDVYQQAEIVDDKMPEFTGDIYYAKTNTYIP